MEEPWARPSATSSSAPGVPPLHGRATRPRLGADPARSAGGRWEHQATRGSGRPRRSPGRVPGRGLLARASLEQRAGRLLRLARARVPQGAVLPVRLDHLPPVRRRRDPRARRPLDLEPGTEHAATVGPRGVECVGGLAVTSVAFHVDQLFFDAPGGIGTYVRNLAPALARADPSLDLKLFHARFGPDGRHRSVGSATSGSRSSTGRSARCIRVGISSAARRSGLPPVRGRGARDEPRRRPPGDVRQRLVVTVHDSRSSGTRPCSRAAGACCTGSGSRRPSEGAHAMRNPVEEHGREQSSPGRGSTRPAPRRPLAPALAQGRSRSTRCSLD